MEDRELLSRGRCEFVVKKTLVRARSIMDAILLTLFHCNNVETNIEMNTLCPLKGFKKQTLGAFYAKIMDSCLPH